MKLNFSNEFKRNFDKQRRSGWGGILKTFKGQKISSNSVHFDLCVEKTFFQDRSEYKLSWVGIMHHPNGNYPLASNNLFLMDTFLNSLKYCEGLFVFSIAHKTWLEERQEIAGLIPVCVLQYPVDKPKFLFNIIKFKKNSNRKTVQIGDSDFLDPLAIFELDTLKLCKKAIIPYNARTKMASMNAPKGSSKFVQKIRFMNKFNYDQLLEQNIVFLRYNAVSAPIVVVECILRNTPVLVNPLDSVVEYLGIHYPFYYMDLEEAKEKANDIKLIQQTHKYLKHLKNKENYSYQHFLNSIVNSEIHKSLE